MTENAEKAVKGVARAVAAGALVVASPLTACGLMAANLYIRRRMARELKGGRRTAALFGANAVMCLAAGAVSVAFSSVAVALVAAGALTWLFKPEDRHAADKAMDDAIIIDAKTIEVCDEDACSNAVARRRN